MGRVVRIGARPRPDADTLIGSGDRDAAHPIGCCSRAELAGRSAVLAGARRCNTSHWPLPDGFQPGTHLPDNYSLDVQACVLPATHQRHWFSSRC